MISGAQQLEPEKQFLNQGDVIGDCWIRQPAIELVFLEQCGKTFSGKPDFRSRREPQQHDRRQFILAEAKCSSAIILTYGCDLDKVLDRIAAGEAPNPSELCFIAPIFPITNYPRYADDIRSDAVENVAYVEPAAGRTELVIDFSFAQSMNMRQLLVRVKAGRDFGLDDAGRTELMMRWARHFGSDERVRKEPPRTADPTLLVRAMEIVLPSQSAT